jgi:hypothetical protein
VRWVGVGVVVLCAACRDEWPCEGPPAGAVVCQSCIGASDSNTGTARCPLRTINAGIAHAREAGLGEVSLTGGGEYAEDIVVPSGLALRGRSASGRVTIRNTTPQGLRFAEGARGASVSGVQVIPIDIGISVVDASASLEDFEVLGGGRIGLNVVATGVRKPHVWIGSYRPEVPRSRVDGLRVDGTSPLIFGLDVTGGASISNAPALWWDDGTVGGGVHARGALDYLELGHLTVNDALAFEGCTGQPQVHDSSMGSVSISGGCAAVVHRSRVGGAVRVEDSAATLTRSYVFGAVVLLRSAARVTNTFGVSLDVTASAVEVNSCTFVSSSGAAARLNGPSALRGNDFFSPDGGALYVDEGSTVFNTPSQIDSESRSFDPTFAPAPPVLSLGSPLRQQGPVDAGVPDVDIRGVARHVPPDIGAYELE